MSNATLSILGLFRFDKTIFDYFALPAGINKDTLINELLTQCAEFEILYPDPLFMKHSIAAWSKTYLFKWEKLLATMGFDYDPISNYDRHEKWTDTENITDKRDLKDNTTVTPGSTETTATQGYDNAGFVDAAKVTRGGKDESSLTQTGETTRDGKTDREGRAWGNIGVTTSQQMIQSERDISDFNIYQIIINDFQSRYCIMIY